MIPTGTRRGPSPDGDAPANGDAPPSLASIETRLRAYQAELVDAWLREIVPISSVAYRRDDLRHRLTHLVNRLIAILVTEDELALDAARQLGRELADLLYMSTEGLGRSHTVLSNVLIRAVPGEWRELRSAVVRVITAIICGYHDRTRFTVLHEQETMVDALVTRLERTQGELRASQARFDSVFNDSALGIWVGDLEGHTLEANQALLDLLGLSLERLRVTDVAALIHPDDREQFGPLWSKLVQGKSESFQTETRYLHKQGHTVWGHLTITLVRDGTGETLYIVAMLQDVGEQRRDREAARHAVEHLRALVQNSADIIAVVNGWGEITYISPAASTVLGYEPDDLIKKHMWSLLDARDLPMLRQVDDFWDRLRAHPEQTQQGSVRLRRKDGSWRWIGVTCANRFEDPGIQGIVINARDVTSQIELEDRLSVMAYTDPLTGLASRRAFTERLQSALDGPQPIAVLFADLDRFKLINDSLGHEAGDQALVTLAERFRACVAPHDLVARLGGDEFAILLNGADEASAWETSQCLLQAMRAPVTLYQHQTVLNTSIGVAVRGPDLDSLNALWRAADLALYRAKAQGRAKAAMFEPALHDAAVNRLEMEADLRQAQARGQLFVAYQPEVDLQTGQTVALEALVRWEHPTRGLVPPDDFVEIAEETGQIIPIGRWVMAAACQQMRRWREAGVATDAIVLAVNLTSRELRQEGLVAHVAGCLRAAALAPAQLCLEVSEWILIDDVIAATPVLHALRELGVQIAIDDFGAGYTSITSWPEFTASMLKIDRALTGRLSPGENGFAFIQAFTTLAHTLNMQVCAEGIETADHLFRVLAAGCDHGQGYYFSPALHPDDVPAFLARASDTDAAPAGAAT